MTQMNQGLKSYINFQSSCNYIKELSDLNTYMLSFIYPDDYKEKTAPNIYEYDDYENYT